MRKARIAAVTIGAVSLVCASSVASATAASARPARPAFDTGGTLTQLIPSDPGNLDPLMTVTGTTRGLDAYAYDPLVNETAHGTIVSGLADKWSQSGDKYTFALRRGVTCSDGSTLSASTVADNVNFVADAKNDSPLLGIDVPVGAVATADDATSTVTVTTAGPAPFFFDNIADLDIVCSKGMTTPSSLAEGTDGTGPYELSSAVAGEQYTFTERHGYHWGPSGASTGVAGMPGKIVVKVVSNETTEASLLLEGEANVATVNGIEDERLSAAKLYHESATAPMGELWFNEKAGSPEASQDVRRALTMALDLPEIGKVLTQDQGQRATGLVTVTPKPCTGNTVEGNVPSYDTSEAKKLLADAGWRPGAGGIRTKDGKKLTVTVLYANDIGGDPTDAFELAAQEWSKVGVKTHLVSDTTTSLESVIFGTGVWSVADVPLGLSEPSEAVPFVSGVVPPKGEDFGHIDDPAYNRLAATASAASGTTACPEWNTAEADLFKAVDVVPFENVTLPTWGKSAKFTIVSGLILPTSLRLERG